MGLTLIKHVHIYAPEDLGIKDILFSNSKIIAIYENIDAETYASMDWFECIDGKGMILTPGFIDGHVHIAGAGGEGGPASRTPEVQLSELLSAGVTSVVGCLGTDGLTRSIESVLMKAKGLKEEGISAWIYSGAYQLPTPTLSGDIGKDLAIFEEVIGAGEIALSDHRSSNPNQQQLQQLAGHCRVGGMLGNKAGIVHIHMGDAKDPFRPIHEAVENSEISYKQFLPTHCNRNEYIFEDAKEYGMKGYIDITSSSYPFYPEYEIKPSRAIKELLDSGVPLGHITMTSDAGGSLPDFDETGNLVKLETGKSDSLLREIRDMIFKESMSITEAISTVTSNVAGVLKLRDKGRIKENLDADIIIFDNSFKINYLFCKGKKMISNGQLLTKGAYE